MGAARSGRSEFRILSHLGVAMQVGDMISKGLPDRYDASDIDREENSDVDADARELEEEFSRELDDYRLDKEALDDAAEHGSYCAPSYVDSDSGSLTDENQFDDDIASSIDDAPNQKTLERLSELASEFSRTVKELRRSIPASSAASSRSDSVSRFSPPRLLKLFIDLSPFCRMFGHVKMILVDSDARM